MQPDMTALDEDLIAHPHLGGWLGHGVADSDPTSCAGILGC